MGTPPSERFGRFQLFNEGLLIELRFGLGVGLFYWSFVLLVGCFGLGSLFANFLVELDFVILVMNKARRHELKMLKYKKRLRRIGQLNAETIASPKGEKYNFVGYKNHSVPCSCFMCSHRKFNRAKTNNDPYYKQASQSLHI